MRPFHSWFLWAKVALYVVSHMGGKRTWTCIPKLLTSRNNFSISGFAINGCCNIINKFAMRPGLGRSILVGSSIAILPFRALMISHSLPSSSGTPNVQWNISAYRFSSCSTTHSPSVITCRLSQTNGVRFWYCTCRLPIY